MSKQAVKLIAADLQIGEDSGFVQCPFCMAEHEEKFSVTRTPEGILYNCFRASCGASGFVGTGYWEADYGQKPVRPKRRPYTGALHLLDIEDKRFFTDTWGIHPTGFRVTDYGEYAFPIWNPVGMTKGWVIRQPRWKGVYYVPRTGKDNPDYPKALTYKDEPDQSKLAWAIDVNSVGAPKDPHIVIVEDQLSAWKVSQCSDSVGVALLGADLGYEEVKELGSVRPLSVLIWMDPDATNAAYKIQSKWGLSFNYCSVVTSKEDPKDMSPKEIKEIVHVAF